MRTELRTFATRLGHQPLYRQVVEDAVHNIGLVLAVQSLCMEDDQPLPTLEQLMSFPCVQSVRTQLRPDYRTKFELFDLVIAIGRQAHTDVAASPLITQHSPLADPHIANDSAWTQFAGGSGSRNGGPTHKKRRLNVYVGTLGAWVVPARRRTADPRFGERVSCFMSAEAFGRHG